MKTPVFQRLFQALLLRRSVYEYAAREPDSWREAVAVVCIVALAEGLSLSDVVSKELGVPAALTLFVVMAYDLVCWLLVGLLAYPIGRLVTPRAASTAVFDDADADHAPDLRRLLRCFGFGTAPVVLRAFGFLDPSRSWLPMLVGTWLFASSFVAYRAALPTTNARAALAAFLLRATIIVIHLTTGVQLL